MNHLKNETQGMCMNQPIYEIQKDFMNHASNETQRGIMNQV